MRLSAVPFVCMCIADAYTGLGTAYSGEGEIDATGKNMCEFDAPALPSRWQRYYAAMNEAQWEDGDVCGRCIRVTGKAGVVIAKVVDQCPSWACDYGNVDFSTHVRTIADSFSLLY